MSNSLLELRMRISPSATWLDGFFIDIVLMLIFPIYPETRKDEWIRESIIHHELSEVSSSLTLWIHRDIVLDLSLDMNQTTLECGIQGILA